MKQIIMLCIQIYWQFPNRIKNKCLHKESCSRYIYRQLKYGNLKKGYSAFKERIKTCNPHYKVIDLDKNRIVIFANGEFLQQNQLADWLKIKKQ